MLSKIKSNKIRAYRQNLVSMMGVFSVSLADFAGAIYKGQAVDAFAHCTISLLALFMLIRINGYIQNINKETTILENKSEDYLKKALVESGMGLKLSCFNIAYVLGYISFKLFSSLQ